MMTTRAARMIVQLRDIPYEGITLFQTVQPGQIDLEDEELKLCSPLEVEADVHLADEELIVKTQVRGTYEFRCGRCLLPVRQERRDTFDLYIDVEPKTDSLDLMEDIRQELVICLSGVVICRDDCRGLCPTCGKNLNIEDCDCRKEGPDKGVDIRPAAKQEE